MAKPVEVKLRPGWLLDDVRKAQARVAEWHGTEEEGRSAPLEQTSNGGEISARPEPAHSET